MSYTLIVESNSQEELLSSLEDITEQISSGFRCGRHSLANWELDSDD